MPGFHREFEAYFRKRCERVKPNPEAAKHGRLQAKSVSCVGDYCAIQSKADATVIARFQVSLVCGLSTTVRNQVHFIEKYPKNPQQHPIDGFKTRSMYQYQRELQCFGINVFRTPTLRETNPVNRSPATSSSVTGMTTNNLFAHVSAGAPRRVVYGGYLPRVRYNLRFVRSWL